MVSQPTGEPTRKNAARLKYDVPFGIGNYFSAIPCWLLAAVATQKTRWQKMAEEDRDEAQVKPAMTSNQFGPSNFRHHCSKLKGLVPVDNNTMFGMS
jgi:hypothetical protein